MKKETKQTASRKYQLTINNPQEKNLDHETIKVRIKSLKGLIYYCMADEIGEQGTPHTHIYLCYKNAKRFSTIKSTFPEAHIEKARGTSKENRDYIRKEGKYQDSDKKHTNLVNTFEEEGELPIDDRQGERNDFKNFIQFFEEGMTPYEIITENPQYQLRFSQLETLFQAYRKDMFEHELRSNMHVIYLSGPTGSGKTSSILEEFQIEHTANINCQNKHPFDAYNGEATLVLDEFSSSIPIGMMNQILDIYPFYLPCRYNDKLAMYQNVVVISNIPLKDQYPDLQETSPEIYRAFLRRFHEIRELTYFKKIQYFSIRDAMRFLGERTIENLSKVATVEIHISRHAKKALQSLYSHAKDFKNYGQVYAELINDPELQEKVNGFCCEKYNLPEFDIKKLIEERYGILPKSMHQKEDDIFTEIGGMKLRLVKTLKSEP